MQNNLKNLFDTYNAIKKNFPEYEIEEFPVVENVMKHRFFWKPEKVRIVLLAESHVFTTLKETKQLIQYAGIPELKNFPLNFAKFVYCLGYGEKKICDVEKNYGT